MNFKEPLRGIMHAFIFYGFVVNTIHTTSQMIAGLIGYGMDDPYKFSLVGFYRQKAQDILMSPSFKSFQF